MNNNRPPIYDSAQVSDHPIEIGTYCIFTGKYDKGFPCVIIAYDGSTAVVRRLRGGYVGVEAAYLSPTTQEKAQRAFIARAEKLRAAR